MQVRRSALYVPVNNARALAKTATLGADVFIYDFEDSVLADQKIKARDDLAAHLSAGTGQSETVLRINAVNTSAFHQDINWLSSGPAIDAILLPKVRHVSELKRLGKSLEKNNLQTPVWVMVETIDAVLNLAEIVSAMSPGCALVLGSEDLAREMRITHTPGRLGLLPILTQLVLHGRQAKLSIIDAVFPKFDNELGFQQSCEQARNLGFDGKSLIHPAQINTSNQVFSPTPQEIENAIKIIDAWAQKPDHLGIVSVDGQMIESLHVDQANEVLEITKHINS